ncbi:hypothetical protein H2248_002311 [Termitomyces sp. 'cryptogamus']|nr:hypothetical protein H2248_002311 [Termitomyces sp. 'cryptogamus']
MFLSNHILRSPSCQKNFLRCLYNSHFKVCSSAVDFSISDAGVHSLPILGSAIYVYFILPNFVSTGTTTETLCNFTLDGDSVSTFRHIPSTSHDYIFNALVFSKENLPGNNSHTLLISTSGLDRDVFTSFDYAIYQFDDGIDITTSQPSPTTIHDQPVVTVTPQTSTTIVSGTPVVTTISNAPTRSQSPTLVSSDTISSLLPSSLSRATIITSGMLVTTVTTGTVLATSSSLIGTSGSQGSNNNTEDGNTAHSTPIGAIVGGVVGGVAVILLLVLVIFLLCRRRRPAHMALPSNIDDLTPRHPVLTPFTSFPPDNPGTEVRAQERRLPATSFHPVRKQRDAARMRELEDYHSPYADESSSSEIFGAQDRSMISEQTNSLAKELDQSESSARGLNHFGGPNVTEILQQNQAMRTEIGRLQAQLNSDQAHGLINEAPPGYSKHAADIHRLTSSATPVAIS